MLRNITLLLLLCAGLLPAQAQKKVSLSPEPVTVAETYHFRNIEIKDNRLDTTILGRVVKGMVGVSEALVPLKLKDPAIPSFEAFFAGCTETLNKGQQDILINITDIFLDEDPVTGSVGTVDVRAEVYAIKDGLYYPIHTFDYYEVVTAFDATKKMIRTFTTAFKNILEYANNFYKPEVFTKKGLTLTKYVQYAASSTQDGIFGTFQEFLDNKPGRPINMLDDVIAKNLDKPKRKREDIYGYCKDGIMYGFEGNKYDTNRIYRKGTHFYMQNYGLDPDKQGDQNALLWFSSLALLMNTDSWYEYVLNPRTGNWYQLTKLGNKKRKTEEQTEQPAEPSE
jgi:hypothetical protein